MTVRELIAFAFSPTQLVSPRPPILNGPDWLDDDRFDIVALARGYTTAGRARDAGLALMMRSVLASRFRLRIREEVRPLPVYDLSLLKDDGTWGPRLRRSTVDCFAPLPALFSGRPLDGSKPRRDSCRSEGGDGYLRSGAMTMSHLASMLSNRMRTVVHDRTGLVGPFAIDLAWPLDHAPSGSTRIGFTGFVERAQLADDRGAAGTAWTSSGASHGAGQRARHRRGVT